MTELGLILDKMLAGTTTSCDSGFPSPSTIRTSHCIRFAPLGLSRKGINQPSCAICNDRINIRQEPCSSVYPNRSPGIDNSLEVPSDGLLYGCRCLCRAGGPGKRG